MKKNNYLLIGEWKIVKSNRPRDVTGGYDIYNTIMSFRTDEIRSCFPNGRIAKLNYIINNDIIEFYAKHGLISSAQIERTINDNEILFKYSDGFYELWERCESTHMSKD